MSGKDGTVLVIGSAGVDVKARPFQPLTPGADNLGAVRSSIGGVGRNIATNLALLGVPVTFISAVGDDLLGRRVLEQTRGYGVNCRYVRRIAGEATGTHVALQHPDGDLDVAVSDFAVVRHINPEYLDSRRRLFASARLIVIDANMSDEALAVIFELAERYRVPVCADPTSPLLATRLCPYLERIFVITPNAAETSAICGVKHRAYDRETAIDAARQLIALGVELAVVTLGATGVAYADANGAGHIGTLHTQIVDSTGAGDAFTAAMIFGLLNEVPVDEAMRLGMTAASLTLQTTETVLPELSQELLYARLVV